MAAQRTDALPRGKTQAPKGAESKTGRVLSSHSTHLARQVDLGRLQIYLPVVAGLEGKGEALWLSGPGQLTLPGKGSCGWDPAALGSRAEEGCFSGLFRVLPVMRFPVEGPRLGHRA